MKYLYAAATAVLMTATGTFAQTTVGGPILSDTTWILSGSPYELASPILIGQSATLTIEPGVEVHFLGGKFMSVGQGSLGPGALVAIGTANAPIRFTSPAAVPGSWEAIIFPDVAIDTVLDGNDNYVSGSVLEHCIVEYGGSSASYLGAVDLDKSSVLVESCVFQNNQRRGMSANMADGTSATPRLILRTSEFLANDGGGLYVTGGASHRVAGCVFADNTTSGVGGGLALSGAPDTHVELCQFMRNTGGPSGGGGAYISSCANLLLRNSTFDENLCSSDAGCYLLFSTSILVEDCVFSGNQCISAGGLGIRSCSGVLSGTEIRGNIASSDGAGLYLINLDSSFNVLNCTIEDNQASIDGGGIYIANGSPMLEGCTIFRNNAGNRGGGIFQSASNIIRSCTITENTSGMDGGGIYASGGTYTLDQTIISCNSAINGGGGLYIKNGMPNLDGDDMAFTFNTFQGNSAAKGDAIYNDRAFQAGGGGDTSAAYLCWGPMDPNTVPNRLWDFFDDPSLGIMIASNFASCSAIECGCFGSTYCVTSINSAGNGARIGYSGTTSIVNNDLALSVTGCPANKSGLFFYGPSQIQVPFGDGQRCVGGSLTRLAVISTDLNGNASQALNYANQTGTAQIVAGSTWNFQFWYRDPAAGGSGFNVSDGLEVKFCQ